MNVNGGAIAIGHPIGVSERPHPRDPSAREQKGDAKEGIATLCVGGGMGVAMCVSAKCSTDVKLDRGE